MTRWLALLSTLLTLSAVPDVLAGGEAGTNEPRHVRIRLSEDVRVLDRATPLGLGRRHVERLADGQCIVSAREDEIREWLAGGLVVEAADVAPDDKLSYGLRRQLPSMAPGGSLRLLLLCYPDVGDDDAISRVEQALTGRRGAEADAEPSDPSSGGRVEFSQRQTGALVLGVEVEPFELPSLAALDVVWQLWLPEKAIAGDLLVSQDTINVDALKSSGTPATSFRPNGATVTIGQWDTGRPRLSHLMLTPRVTYADADCASPPASASPHATEVAGVLVGASVTGVTTMEGMAHQAQVRSHSFDNDFVEMSLDAEQLIRISNHSYSPRRGWFLVPGTGWVWFGAPDDAEDYLFGKYDPQPRELDSIARTDDLLVVRAAGNNNTNTSGSPHYHVDNPAYRPSLCTPAYTLSASQTDTHQFNSAGQALDVLPQVAVAKNALVVGNALDITTDPVTSEAFLWNLAYSTSFGPTDDMRVKPDVYANGEAVTTSSAGSDTETAEVSGTSFSAPAVAGACALLFETYKALNGGREPSAAELRALVIQTALDKNPVVPGNPSPGPDCRYGWGLMDAMAAASLIERDSAASLEGKYIVRGTYRGAPLLFDVVGGSGGPLEMATMVWTDWPGAASTEGIDSGAAVLVNDLDLTALSAGDPPTAQHAWRLNHCSAGLPDQALNNAPNHSDNVEKVERTSSGSEYAWVQLRVAHTGTLLFSQSFVIVSNVPLRAVSQVQPKFADVATRHHTNGRVDVADAVLALQFSVGSNVPRHHESFLSDVAPFVSLGGAPEVLRPVGNNAIDVGDAVAILRATVGLVQFSPSGSVHYRVTMPAGATYSSVQVTLDHRAGLSPSATAVTALAAGWTCGPATVGGGSVSVTCASSSGMSGPFDLLDFNMDFSTVVPAQDDVQLSTCNSSGSAVNSCFVRAVR